jgi:peptidoglycan/xylan/chitin deacetylase (PgdA/CDA1 family)
MAARLLKVLISFIVRCVDIARAALRGLFGLSPKTTCVVLYYHAVRAEAASQFSAQMDALIRLSIPIDIESRERLEKGLRYSAVTFDDGFVSVIENALPALSARNIPCTIFVPTGSIGRRPTWIDLSHDDGAEIVLSAPVLVEIAKRVSVGIGSHSVSHPDFRRLDDEQVRRELHASKLGLEQILGREITSFSFPHGAYTRRSLELARECDYERVFTIEPMQFGDPREAFVIGRVRVEPHDWAIEFRLKVVGAYRWLPRVSRMKRWVLRRVGKHRLQVLPEGP